MKILMVGGGGREHALIKALQKSPRVRELHCAPGNGGISKDATCHNVGATDIPGMVALAQELQVDLCFVAPDDPLALGMVDAMSAAGIRAFGPTAAAAQLESSKVFAKDLMKRTGIPTAGYEVFDDPAKAQAYIKAQNRYPTVIKADGLALGKGVIIAQNEQESFAAIDRIMLEQIFGDSGRRIVVEEFIEGPEVSVLSFCDGKTVVPMVSSMDHKRALDGDLGPNTGGMGTFSPNPFYTPDLAKHCMDEIFLPTVRAMQEMGAPFLGCLYFGLMLTKDGPKVIEYNCRFGDPETQVVLPRLKTDLADILDAVIDGTLDQLAIEWDENACACVVMASGGYPIAYDKGFPITGLNENGQLDGAVIYHAGTACPNGQFVTAGGRVLGVTATGNTLDQALADAYAAVEKIQFSGAHFRRDIGRKKI